VFGRLDRTIVEVTAMPGPILTRWTRLRTCLKDLGNLLFFALVLGAGAAVLWRVACQAPRPASEQETKNRPGGGITLRHQLLHIWLPGPLVALAKRPSGSIEAQSHHQLRKLLERLGNRDLCYAFTVRAHQVNSDTAEISFIRHLYSEPENFQELMELLAAAEGSSPDDPAAEIPRPTVHIMPANWSERELREAVQASARLLDPARSENDP
jgi:hypothetical protein